MSKKQKPACRQAGMTYVELIVVLSIFSVLSSVAIYNYGDFQAKIDVRNLASDIALKIVEAQKTALSGSLPINQLGNISPTWKPSYGVYFSSTIVPDSKGADYKNFIYFTDLNSDSEFTDSACAGECIEEVTITKDSRISNLQVFYEGNSTPDCVNNMTITFSRPSSGAIITSSEIITPPGVSYVKINLYSPGGARSSIKLFPSGRIQIDPAASGIVGEACAKKL